MLNLYKIKETKDIHIINQIIDFKSPNSIFIPIEGEVNYKIGDYVYKSSDLAGHTASVSGFIKSIKEKYIEIENDFKENANKRVKIPKINTTEELLNLLEKNHLESIASKIINLENVNSLVVTSIDEEVYSASELFRLANNYIEVLDTMDNLYSILKLNKMILATKSTNFKSIKSVKSVIGTYPNIKVSLVPDKYLISRNNFICEYLNMDVKETLVLTTADIYNISKCLSGKSITESLVTISGNAIEKSLVLNVRLYTSLNEIIKNYINIINNNYEIFVNGYLGGSKWNGKDIFIDGSITSIVIASKESTEESMCINCGACQKICPFNINVKFCYLNKISNKKCINCGLCEYICPANLKIKSILAGDKYE